MMKQKAKSCVPQVQHEYQHPNNILSGDQPLQALNYQLVKLKQTK